MLKFEPGARRSVLVLQVLWFVVWAVITGIAWSLSASPQNHGTHVQLGLAPCPAVLLWGRMCPGCGLTTSFTSIAHFDLVGAFLAHPFGPALYAVFTWTAWASLLATLRNKRLETNTRGFNWVLIVLLSGFFVYGIARFVWGRRVPPSEAYGSIRQLQSIRGEQRGQSAGVPKDHSASQLSP